MVRTHRRKRFARPHRLQPLDAFRSESLHEFAGKVERAGGDHPAIRTRERHRLRNRPVDIRLDDDRDTVRDERSQPVGGGGAGGDKSVMALLYADSYVELRKFAQMADPHMATMELCGRVKSVWEALRPRFVVIDAVGVGLGVLHRLREEGVPALAFGAGERCDLRDRSGELGFANWRASGWWTLREALEPGAGIGLALPEDDELTGELTAPSYRVNSTGRIQIEEKEALRGRLHRSTDSADALIHALCGPLLAQEEQGGSRYAVVEDLVPRKARY